MAVPRTVVLRGETQWRINGVGKVHGAPECRGAEFQAKLKKTNLQILGCGLHKNVFGGRASPEPTGGARALPQTP